MRWDSEVFTWSALIRRQLGGASMLAAQKVSPPLLSLLPLVLLLVLLLVLVGPCRVPVEGLNSTLCLDMVAEGRLSSMCGN